MNREEFSEACRFLSKTPETVRAMVESLTAEEQRLKLDDKNFSVLENVCHLRDIEERGYRRRIEKILTEDNPELVDVDGDRLAVERDYQNQNLSAELRLFSEYRAESLSLLREISLADLERTGFLENVGVVTLGGLLLIMTEHDREHLSALSELCALNK